MIPVITIDGPSGAGKSTLIDCILGLISATSGQITIDNRILNKKNVASWQKNLGYVPQDIYLLDGTIRENISFGISPNSIDEKKIQKAVEKAQLSDFANSLPEGLNTIVGERGVRLSGGQRQRIGIARALYVNPELLILDEATNEIDSVTESKIMNNLVLLEPKKTILIISHKKESLANCNSTININEFAI